MIVSFFLASIGNLTGLGFGIVTFAVVSSTAYFAWKNQTLQQSRQQTSDANEQTSEWRSNYLAERQLREDQAVRHTEVMEAHEAKYEQRLAAMDERLIATEKREAEQRDLKHEALTEVAALRMSTDLTLVLKAIADIKADVTTQLMKMTEQLALFSDTQVAQTAALEAIARRLELRASAA